MTKGDIIRDIAASTGTERTVAASVIEAFMENVRSSIVSGENVYLRGFGTFQVKQRAEKVARNISKNTTIVIPAHSVPAFKPAKEFAEKVKKGK